MVKHLLEWRPRHEELRSRGRPPRWADDMKRMETNWVKVMRDRNKWQNLPEPYVKMDEIGLLMMMFILKATKKSFCVPIN